MKNFLARLFPIVFAFAAVSAHASVLTFVLNRDACTGTCGTGPFATVTITDFGAGNSAYVVVSETLAANERFAGTGAGKSLEFNLVGNVTLTSLPTGFASVGAATASAFGSFSQSVGCTVCQGGQAGNPAGPLSFNVTSPTGVTTAMFTVNASGYYFASDIVGNNGNTGNVGTNTAAAPTPTPTPEPGSLLMSACGFAILGITLLRKKAIMSGLLPENN